MSENSGERFFEESFSELEKIVHHLEEGNVSLEDSLKLYENGVRLLRECHELLEGARRKIEILTQVDENGVPVIQVVDDMDLSLEEKAKTRGRRK
ncbi:MAG: exodeoxyribonuclease VII small subunit [Planctomycetia bacterium]|nr:exodeoxyribonuclease VII small subunit [Planctomycetia bacterium]